MQKIGWLVVTILFCQLSTAQYTEVINSKRPGFSDSPYSVGTGVYQVEMGFFYKNVGNYLYYDPIAMENFNYSATSYGTNVNLRTGQFFNRLEFNLDLDFGNEKRNYTRPTTYSESAFGISKLTVGAKYMVYSPTFTDKSKEIRSWKARTSYDWKRLIPAIGVYAGLNTNFLTKMHSNPDGISPRFGLFTQNDLTNKFILLTNFIADKTFTDQSEYAYIITATYSVVDRVSIFVENQGFFRTNVPNDYQYGIGGAYLVTKNLQVDASLRFINDERGDDTFFGGIGLSWRLDRHVDGFKTVDSEGNEAKNQQEGFFSRIFGGGKNPEQRKVKSVKAKKRKIKEIKPKKTKEQKAKEKALKKSAKQAKKEQKKKEKDAKKNYEPPKNG